MAFPIPKAQTPAKPFSVWLYLLIVILFSWPLQIWFVMKATSPFEKYLFSSLSMVMVTVATLIAGRFVFKDGFTNAGWSWGKPVHYLFVLLFALFIWFVPSLIEIIYGLHKPAGKIIVTNMLWMFFLRFAGTLIPGFGEEFGWRSYMLPRLSLQFGARNGLLLHAFIWWFWHLPVVIGMAIKTTGTGNSVLGNVLIIILITVIPTMLHAVIFAFIWAKTKSLAIVTVYHASFDEVRDTLENSVGFGPFVEIWQMVTIIIVGGLILWKAKWKKLLIPSHLS